MSSRKLLQQAFGLAVVALLLVGCGGAPAAPTATASALPPTPTPFPATATATPLPPTATPTPLAPTATPTRLPPTATPIPQPPTATPTEVPPEPTATVEPTAEPVAMFEEALCPFHVGEGQVVECGFVVVPENHSDPDGPTIRLAVAVFKDQSEERLPDPVIVLSGGPGEKTIQYAPLVAQMFAPVHPNRDLVLFDQRGVGLSEPALECPEVVQALFDLLDEPDPEVELRTVFEATMACKNRLVSEGYNLAAYNTVQNAADVNDIRLALGYEQVNLYGGSYGALLAQATMRDHPEGIRSVIMDSTLPPEKSVFVDAPSTAAKAVVQLLDACTGDEACNTAYPSLQEVLFDTIEQLNAQPVPISVTNPLDGQSYEALLTGDAVFDNLVFSLYQTPIIPVLPKAIYQVSEGDYDLMAQLTGQEVVVYGLVSQGMTYSVFCTDDLIGRRPQDYLDVMAGIAPPLAGRADAEDVIEYGFFAICDNWPVEQADPSIKEPLVSDIPTLVLAGEFDPVTPSEYGQLVAENLSNSYFFEFPGVGHSVAVASPCARSVVRDFLEDPMTAPKATCIAKMLGVAFEVPVEPTGEITQATMAKSVDPQTSAPLEATDTFMTDVPEIYCVFKISGGAGTKATARWVLIQGDDLTNEELVSHSLRLEQDIDPPVWGYFSITPPEQGWWVGSYEVTLYLDDEEVTTLPFTVAAP